MCVSFEPSVCSRQAASILQVDADPISEDCPVFTNAEFPLVVDRFSTRYAVFLGSFLVSGLAPKTFRVAFPRISRVPATDTNATNTCLVVYVDSAHNVPEPYDGPVNIAARKMALADIRRCVCAILRLVLGW